MSTISISDSLASSCPATSLKRVSHFWTSSCLALLLAKPNAPKPPPPLEPPSLPDLRMPRTIMTTQKIMMPAIAR